MNVMGLIKRNRSRRRFTDRAVSESELHTLIEAASLTGSAGNLQQLRFVPVGGAAASRVFPHLRWAGYLADWDGPCEGERPTAYIVVLCPKEAQGKFYTGVDVGIAAQSMLLCATDMGLGGCMFASVERPALMQALALDADTWEIALVIALGEPLEEVRIVPVTDGNIKYYRDENGVHYVPKRTADELTLLPGIE